MTNQYGSMTVVTTAVCQPKERLSCRRQDEKSIWPGIVFVSQAPKKVLHSGKGMSYFWCFFYWWCFTISKRLTICGRVPSLLHLVLEASP